MVELNKLSN